jgi:site-specific recombinase XerD
MNNLTAPYKLWLENKNYSASTVKNYLVDLNRYLVFIENSDPFSFDSIAAFLESLKNDSNANRYTSSLSKFLQFAQDQKLIEVNPIKKIKSKENKPSNDIENLLTQYQVFLNKRHFSPVTIKNYLNDIEQFVAWSKTLESK